MAKDKGKRIPTTNRTPPGGKPKPPTTTAKPTTTPANKSPFVNAAGERKFRGATVTGKDAAGNTLMTKKSGDTMAVNPKGRRLAVDKKGELVTNKFGKPVTIRQQNRQADKAEAAQAKRTRTDENVAEARRKAGIARTSPLNSMGMAPSRSARDAESNFHKQRLKRRDTLAKEKRQTEIKNIVDRKIGKAVAAYTPPTTAKPTTTPTTTKPPTTTTAKPPTTPATPTTPLTPTTPKGPQQGASRGPGPTFRGTRQTAGGGGNVAGGGAQGVQRVGSTLTGGSAGQAENRKGGGKFRFV